jgi:predicted acetyltransferase
MIHYGVFENGKMVASVGLYFMTFVSKYGTLKAGCVGAVSTHPDYRKKGYF